MKRNKLFFPFLIVLLLLSAEAFAFTIAELPIQDRGRVKPFRTFANESLQFVHGRSKYNKQDAMRILATWMLAPEIWEEKQIVRIDHHGLKKTLGYEKTRKFFSFKEIFGNQRLTVIMGDLEARRARNEKLDPYYQAISRLSGQINTFYGIRHGQIPVFPRPPDPEKGNVWVPVAELEGAQGELFFKIMSDYVATFTSTGPAEQEKAKVALSESLASFTSQAAAVNPEAYPSKGEMEMEVHYQTLDPFFWSWIFYLLATLLVAFSYIVPAEKLVLGAGIATAFVAFAFHTYGFILRIYITGRPPVSNMYETVIWVAWGSLAFAAVFYFLQRKKFVLLAGLGVCTLAMVVAYMSPVILDPSLQPLMPVLRSNMWLIIHVMTITLSYAAFFVALGVGDYGMVLAIKDREKYKAKIRELGQVCYRLIQVGVVLLAAGTILGGVWADYSWGRFWGWDPKETWAFIALMGYLALLHARLTGWVKEFGTLGWSVIAFSLVLMAWYGVNFVLGAGLHSYGFGAGGVEWVAGFCLGQTVLVAYAAREDILKFFSWLFSLLTSPSAE